MSFRLYLTQEYMHLQCDLCILHRAALELRVDACVRANHSAWFYICIRQQFKD